VRGRREKENRRRERGRAVLCRENGERKREEGCVRVLSEGEKGRGRREGKSGVSRGAGARVAREEEEKRRKNEKKRKKERGARVRKKERKREGKRKRDKMECDVCG
jgi:hypothetical protein